MQISRRCRKRKVYFFRSAVMATHVNTNRTNMADQSFYIKGVPLKAREWSAGNQARGS